MCTKKVRHAAGSTHRLTIDEMKSQISDELIQEILKFKDEN